MDPKLSRRSVLSTVGTVTLLDVATVGAGATQDDITAAVDPREEVRVTNFTVELDNVEVPGWRSVTIPAISLEQAGPGDGTDPESERKNWGQPSFDDLRMERGFSPTATDLSDWFEAIRSGTVEEGKKDISVTLEDEENEPVLVWRFDGAWITEYDPLTRAPAEADLFGTESAVVGFDTMRTEWDP